MPKPRLDFMTLCLLPFLSSCAAHYPAPAAVQPAPLEGSYKTGIVLAVRDVDPSVDPQTIDAVLSALNQAAQPGATAHREIVIQLANNAVASFVEPVIAAQPSDVPGEKVAIVEAGVTVIKRQ